MENKYKKLIGMGVTGSVEKKRPNPLSRAQRLPACIVIDTSGSMRDYSDLLHTAVVNLIEQLAKDPTALSHIDLEIITFNLREQINIKIPAQELKNLVNENGELKEAYKSNLEFVCEGGTPTGYALHVAVSELRDRYQVLKETKKAPLVPIMFFLSDGKPEVSSSDRIEHDKVLADALDNIKQLVNENRLSVIAVEVGDICEAKNDSSRKNEYEDLHKLMRAITGLDNDHHVRQAVDGQELQGFFVFTETLLKLGSRGELDLNDMNLQNELN